MEYRKLADLYSRLESTTKRLEKTDLIADFLKKTSTELLPPVTLLLLGRVFPTWSEKELGIGPKLLMRAISMVTGASVDELEEEIREQGDIGTASEVLFKRKSQLTFISHPLTVEKVYNDLRKLASITGSRAQSKKIDILLGILSLASPLEAKYITRTILEELRVGAGEGIISDAISSAFNIDKEVVERAYMLTNDLGMVAKVAKSEGDKGLKKLSLEPGRPVKPMLAQLAESIESAIEELGEALCETKYDGVRVQIHRKGDEILVFTRRLENISRAVPEIIKRVEKSLPMEDFIVEGEIIVNIDGRPGSFQYILQRVKRKYDIEKMVKKIPLTLYLFDVLYYKKPLIDEPFKKRREILELVIKPLKGKIELSRQVKVGTGNVEDGISLFRKSVKEGHEGIMIKDPNAPYIPGIRGKKMLKYKAEPETLDLVVVGGTYGKGKRAHFIGSYLLAARDEETGELKTVAHVATGLDDKTLKELTERLKKITIEEKGGKIKVKPELILEVAYSEIVRSPEYESGYSLRFPVVKRIRDDLSLEDVDTINRIESLFKK